MKKINENKKIYIKYIFLFLMFFIFNLSIILSKELNNLDEIWNFNFANCFSKGLVPYKEFNIVITPFSIIIESIFLKVFGQEIMVARILGAFLVSYIEWMIFTILTKLKIKEYIKIAGVVLGTYLLIPFIAYDYNLVNLATVLTIVYFEINNFIKEDKILNFNIKYDIIIGVLLGICVMTKQSTGGIILILGILYKAIEIRSKNDFKEYIKIAFTRIISALIPIIIIFIYLLLNNAINSFIDYAILGIKTFSNKIPYTSLIKNSNVVIKTLSILMPLTVIVNFIIYFVKKKKNLLIFGMYTLGSMVVIYPISDRVHFTIGIFPGLIIIIYIIDRLLRKKLDYKKAETFVNTFFEILVCGIAIFSFTKSMNIYVKSEKNTELAHYKYIIMDESYIESIKQIENYIISNENVYILDACAPLYMIPIDKYNKDYDMFLKGNIGSKGEIGQIEKLKRMNNVKLLIMNENYSRNWQNPEEVRNYIINNLEYEETIGRYDVYVKRRNHFWKEDY